MKQRFTFWMLLAAMALTPLTAAAQDTNCTITLPWSENFDNYTTVGTNTMPECWNRLVGCPYSSTATTPNLATASGHGTVLNLNGSVSSAAGTGVMKIATPLIPASLNSLLLEFDVSGSGLMIYAATDTTDESTFVLIGTFNTASMWSWTSFELSTDTISGIPSGQGYLVFAGAYGTSGYCTARLDNLVVSNLNSCERPASVSVENIGPNTATVTWPYVEDAQGYRVSYSTVNDIDSAETEETVLNSLALTELESGTQYYVWVQTLCSSADTSDARTATFTTQLSCYTVTNLAQIGTGVDAAAFQWEYQNLGNAATGVLAVLHDETDATMPDVVETVTVNSHIFSGLDRTHEYTVTLYTLCGEDTSAAVSAQVIFRHCGETELYTGANDHIADYPLASAYGTSYSIVLYQGDVAYSIDTIRGIALHRYLASTTGAVTRTLNIYIGHTTLDSLTANPGTTGLTQVASNVSYTLAAQEWDTLLFTTPFAYDGHSNLLVSIKDSTGTGTSLSGAAQWYWHISDGKMYYSYGTSGITSAYKQPDLQFVGECNNDFTCEPPAVAMGVIDSMNADINWVGATGFDYVVEYRQQGETVWTVTDTVDALNYSLAGLNPDTYYEVRVGIVCDSATVRYSSVVSFTTDCALMHIPFHFTQNNMVSAATNGFSNCWTHSQYFYRGRLTDSHRGYVRNAGNGEWFMLPAIAEPLNGAQLRTWAASSDQGWFKVGIASLDNCSDVVWVDTIEVPAGNPNTSHNEYVSYLDSYIGTGNRVVVSPIVNNDFHYIYFFDFHVEPITGCRPVADLTFDSSDSNSITFHWTPRGTATQWVVYVDGVATATVNSPSYTATGLEAYTEYDIEVRTLCGEGDTSDGVSGTYRTGCTGEECYVTVYSHAAQGDGWHGARLRVMADEEQIAWFTMLRGSDDELSLRLCAGMHITFDWVAGNDDDLCSFEIVNADGDTLFAISDATGLTAAFLESDTICGGGIIDTNIIDTTVQYTVTVEYDATRGSVTGAGTYPQGATATLTATPFDGFRFAGWSLSPSSSSLVSDNPYTLTLTSDTTVFAHFEVDNDGIDAVGNANFLLAPNPASSVVTVGGIEGEATVSILDLNGRELFRREGVSSSVKVDVTALSKGVYYVKVVTEKASAVRRLVVN